MPSPWLLRPAAMVRARSSWPRGGRCRIGMSMTRFCDSAAAKASQGPKADPWGWSSRRAPLSLAAREKDNGDDRAAEGVATAEGGPVDAQVGDHARLRLLVGPSIRPAGRDAQRLAWRGRDQSRDDRRPVLDRAGLCVQISLVADG